MRTLDRYILKTYVINFFILLLVLMLIFVMIDLLVNLDEFIEAGEHRAKLSESDPNAPMKGQVWYWLLWTIQDYYVPVLLLLFTFLSGLLATAAMGFTFAGMTRNGEVLAMLTAGISMFRIAAPVLVVGALINLVSLPLKEYVIPDMAQKLLRRKSEVMHDVVKTQGAYFMSDDNGNLLSFGDFNATHQTIANVSLLVRNENGATGQRIQAESASWDERGGWLFNDAVISEQRLGQTEPQQATVESQFVESHLSPDVLLLRRHARYIQLLSLLQLDKMQKNPNAAPYQQSILLAMHSRFSFLVVHVLTLLMTMPVFMRREPSRNWTAQALKASALCIGAWAAAILITMAGGDHLNAMAAAWLPVVIFLPISALLLQMTRT